MKINAFLTMICLAISALIAYGLYTLTTVENNVLIVSSSFICFATTLTMAIGASYDTPRTTTNIRTLATSFFVVLLILNFSFVFLQVSNPTYIIAVGIIMCLFLIAFYGIKRANQ
jgi:hypothetical protein